MNINLLQLGTIPLSSNILNKANIGLWAFELDEGEAPRMYVDQAMLGLIGLTHQVSPEETYHAWYDHIDDNCYGLVADAVEKMVAGEHAEVQYPWHHPDGRTMIVRCGGVRNPQYKKGVRIEGTHQDVTKLVHLDEETMRRLKQQEIDLRNTQLRVDTLSFIVDHEGDVLQYLNFFGDRILKMSNCDQVVFHEINGLRVAYNAPGIESISPKICDACPFSDISSKLYSGGRLIMKDCRAGVDGLHPNECCPVKSSASYQVFSNGRLCGLLCFHYIRDKHEFTEDEIELFRVLSQYMGLLHGRIEAAEFDRKAKELDGLKRTLKMVFALAGEYDPVLVLDPVTGKYKWHMSQASLIERDTNLKETGEDFYSDMENGTDSFIHPDDALAFKDFCSKTNLNNIALTGETKSLQVRWHYPDQGGYRWKFIKAVQMLDESDRAFVVAGIVDNTEIKEKEQEQENERKKSMENMEVIAGLADEYISLYYFNMISHVFRKYSIDNGRILDTDMMVNPELDAFEMLHQFARDCVHPDDRDTLLDINYDTVRERLKNRKTFTVRYRRNYGSAYLWSEMDVVKCEDADVAPSIVIVGFAERDKEIKDEVQKQETLQEALVMAQSANRSKTIFLNSMSHDIRTPMNAIIGYTSMAEKYIDDKEKALSYLDKINIAGSNLLELVNQVLDMSRIESGTIILSEDPVNVIDRVYEMTEIMGHSAQAKNIRLTTSVSDIRDSQVFADNGRVNQMIMNIIGNAIKYTPEGGQVSYSAAQIESDEPGYGRYRFVVEDDGIGMSRDFIERIYEPFTRENTSTVTKIQGTGLGMSIVKKLVDLMGGEIDIQSKPGKGTKITVILSFRINENESSETSITGDTSTALNILQGKRVLLVEDNEMNREIATMLLEEQGIIVETADDGDVAVKKIQEICARGDWTHYDFILMDIQMPRMNGYDAARYIRNISAPEGTHVPILAMTANAFAEDRILAIEAGMDDHISKPIDVQALWETLIKYVR